MPSGFLLIDKPMGWTSFDVIAVLRKKFQIKKVGHCGTLDPLATGLLVVALGQGTKLLEYLVGCDKEYEAEVTFGQRSETDDEEGAKIMDPIEKKEKVDFQKLLPNFLGEISQIPPIYSAIKVEGKKVCNMARKGQIVEMKPRKVQIHSIEILGWNWPKARFLVSCGSGTYIRSLARDFGKILHGGAYLSSLRRTKVGEFSLQNALSPEGVSKKDLLPLEVAVSHMLGVSLLADDTKKLLNGSSVEIEKICNDKEKIAVFCDEQLVSISEFQAKKNMIRPLKNIQR